MRADTVVDALADRLGVGKGDILDREEVIRRRNRRSALATKYSLIMLRADSWCWESVTRPPAPTVVRLAEASTVATWRGSSVRWPQ